jgi:hypothetical protein
MGNFRAWCVKDRFYRTRGGFDNSGQCQPGPRGNHLDMGSLNSPELVCAPAELMPLRDNRPESHVIAAADAKESTLEILDSVRPQPQPTASPWQARKSSFIEDVDLWVKQYLNLADEVLRKPEPGTGHKKSAA